MERQVGSVFQNAAVTHLAVRSPPFVPAANIGVADALNVDSRIRVHLTSPLNGFGLGWEYCTGPFRAWFSYRVISLFAPFDIQLIFGHVPPSLRAGYTEEHRRHHIELGGCILQADLSFGYGRVQARTDASSWALTRSSCRTKQ